MDLEVDGTTVHAATGGVGFDPARPLVVFLHGAGMDHTVWALQSRYFGHNRRAVLAPDLPGHGRSAGPPLASVAELGAWVWRLVDAAGGREAALVGHSMGALAALEAAAREPARATALVLLGASAEMPVNDDLLAAAHDDPALASRMIVSWGFGRRGHVGGMRAPGLWMMGGGLSLLERAGDGVLYTDFAACNAYRGGLDAASRVACPTLIVCGDGDRMTPARAAGPLAAAIAAAKTTVIGDAGHMIMVEQPDRTLDALTAFL
jgi:pimeloyl-ACP methyl ester carboxylesterase